MKNACGVSIIGPNRAESSPSRLENLRAAGQAAAVKRAERDGYHLGKLNCHSTSKDYRTSEEWLAWLAGWRQGQAEFRAKLRARGLLWL